MKSTYKYIIGMTLSCVSLFGETLIEDTPGTTLSWNFSDHALFTNAKDPGDLELPAVNQLAHQTVLGLGWGALSTNLAFSNRFTPNGDPSLNRNLILDKKSIVGDWENWEIKLGDSHQEFGRGIALSLFDNQAFGINNTLEGASVKFRNSSLEVGTFGGRVNALKAPVAINPLDSLMEGRDVFLAGGAITANLTSGTKVSTHYHQTLSKPFDKDINKRYQTLGFYLDSKQLGPGIDAYAESNVMDWEAASYGKGMQKKPLSYASFASLSYSDLALKARVELKDYRNFFYDFQRPPTLEEDIVLATNNSDVTAGRAFLERRFQENGASSVGASYLMGADRKEKTSLYHPVIFSKLRLLTGLDVELKGGYRWMPDKNNLAHAAIKTKVKTGKGQYFELELRKQNLNQAITSPLPIREERNIAMATYTFSEKFNVGVGYEHMPTNIPEVGNHFVNGSATYKTGMLTARGFIGQTSGGTQCSSGVCRQVPPFTGAYLETLVTF